MDPKAILANFEARSRAVAELRALDTEAAGREYTADERAKEERINKAIAEYDERIANGLRSMEADKAADEQRAQFEKLTADDPAKVAMEKDADAVRSMLTGKTKSVEFLPTAEETRALAKGGAKGESNLVPTTLYHALHEHLIEVSTVVAAGSTVLRTASGEDIVLPKTTAYSAATIVGEAATIPQSDPTFASVTLQAFKYAFLSKVSSELTSDSAFDIISFLARQGGVAMGNGIGAHLTVGDGSGKPNGVITATTVGKTLASASAVTADEIIDVYHSVPSVYRGKAEWGFNDLTVALVRKLKDSNGNYIWQNGLVAGAPDTLLGKPVKTDPAILGMGAARRVGYFGDLSGYYTRFAGPLRIERSDDFAFDTDQVTFRFIQRADGDLVDTLGIKAIATP